jgi:hypothetical protein
LKSPLYGDVSEKHMMGMFDLIFCSYTNFIRIIEMFVESVLATVSERFAIADHFFLLVRMYRLCVHIIKLPNQLSNMSTLKIIILIKFQNHFWVSNRQRSSFLAIR